MKKIISNLLTIVAACTLLYASYHLIVIFYDYYNNKQVMDDLQDLYYEDQSEADLIHDTDKQELSALRSGFDRLLERNDETVGWITIDGTKVDYPIVQASDNEKYLDRNFYDEESRAGSIFLDYRNDILNDHEKNIILYGHRTKDGSMFQHLTKFLDKDFYNEHKTFEFETLYNSYEAEVFAVYQTVTDFDYIRTDFRDHSFNHYLNEVNETSMFDSDIEVTGDDQIITLSTCDYDLDPDEGRLVVQAKLTAK